MDKPATEKIGVAIIALGGYAADEAALARGLTALEAQHCRIWNYYDPAARHQRFGGTDEARIAQLHAAVNNPEVQVVLALRGGYGVSRLLPKIDFKLLVDSGKLFVGHSDFTALQLALLAQTGAGSFAGPMLCDDFTQPDISDFTLRHFWQCLHGPVCSVSVQADNNPAIEVDGVLWGGNLAILMHLVGTPYCPQIEGGILFVEDINEHPYRVERMLLQLLHAGVLARQKALVLGDFSSYRLTDYDNGYDFNSMLVYLRAHLPIPVLTGLPFGHMRDKVTLPVGYSAHLQSTETAWTLQVDHYPTL